MENIRENEHYSSLLHGVSPIQTFQVARLRQKTPKMRYFYRYLAVALLLCDVFLCVDVYDEKSINQLEC
jgi:hypothetical protein